MLAIIGAMDEEVIALLDRMSDVIKKEVSNVTFYEGLLAGKKVIVSKSGVGRCQSTISTTVLFENFDIDGVINFGTAGGLQNDLKVLDVIVSDHVVNYDADVVDWPKDYDNTKLAYKADEHYISIIKKIIDNDARVFVGNIATGDTFVHLPKQIARIKENYPDALCAEMEGASIAQVCYHYQKPFVIIRSLSDITVNGNSVESFSEYLKLASERSAIWCENFVKMI